MPTGPEGFGSTYIRLWGKPFDRSLAELEVIPGDFAQPDWALPFLSGDIWSYTGGPHPVWGDGLPWARAGLCAGRRLGLLGPPPRWWPPPRPASWCAPTTTWSCSTWTATAMSSTGWVLFHLHIDDDGMVPVGTQRRGRRPRSATRPARAGRATGTHVHIARKYNGEWIPADGLLPGLVPFTLGGWVAPRAPSPTRAA